MHRGPKSEKNDGTNRRPVSKHLERADHQTCCRKIKSDQTPPTTNGFQCCFQVRVEDAGNAKSSGFYFLCGFRIIFILSDALFCHSSKTNDRVDIIFFLSRFMSKSDILRFLLVKANTKWENCLNSTRDGVVTHFYKPVFFTRCNSFKTKNDILTIVLYVQRCNHCCAQEAMSTACLWHMHSTGCPKLSE